MILKIITSFILILLEAFHDSKRAKLEIGSYDAKLDYTTKIYKAIGIVIALSYLSIEYHDYQFAIIYILIRILLFDFLYELFAQRGKTIKEILLNNWVIRFIKMWR